MGSGRRITIGSIDCNIEQRRQARANSRAENRAADRKARGGLAAASCG
jgi:hypothetical protein